MSATTVALKIHPETLELLDEFPRGDDILKHIMAIRKHHKDPSSTEFITKEFAPANTEDMLHRRYVIVATFILKTLVPALETDDTFTKTIVPANYVEMFTPYISNGDPTIVICKSINWIFDGHLTCRQLSPGMMAAYEDSCHIVDCDQ